VKREREREKGSEIVREGDKRDLERERGERRE
jgi:hypothetical protein